jgi:hypothetical protein
MTSKIFDTQNGKCDKMAVMNLFYLQGAAFTTVEFEINVWPIGAGLPGI